MSGKQFIGLVLTERQAKSLLVYARHLREAGSLDEATENCASCQVIV
jgi:hypothetical protein